MLTSILFTKTLSWLEKHVKIHLYQIIFYICVLHFWLYVNLLTAKWIDTFLYINATGNKVLTCVR